MCKIIYAPGRQKPSRHHCVLWLIRDSGSNNSSRSGYCSLHRLKQNRPANAPGCLSAAEMWISVRLRPDNLVTNASHPRRVLPTATKDGARLTADFQPKQRQKSLCQSVQSYHAGSPTNQHRDWLPISTLIGLIDQPKSVCYRVKNVSIQSMFCFFEMLIIVCLLFYYSV